MVMKTLNTTTVSLVLSTWIVREMEYYSNNGFINIDNFITNSVENFLDDNSGISKNCISENSLSKTTLDVNLPVELVKKLEILSEELDTKISDIVSATLGLPLSTLMLEQDVFEEFDLEVKVNEKCYTI